MSEPFLGEIKIVSFSFAPKGWALCNGQLLPINQNQALFALFGTNYGGNGSTTFALPNLQGRVPIHTGGAGAHPLGQAAGEVSHTLTAQEMPSHLHVPNAVSGPANSASPVGNLWAAENANAYSATPKIPMNSANVLSVGGNQPHENMPPYLALNFIVALTGIFPTQ